MENDPAIKKLLRLNKPELIKSIENLLERKLTSEEKDLRKQDIACLAYGLVSAAQRPERLITSSSTKQSKKKTQGRKDEDKDAVEELEQRMETLSFDGQASIETKTKRQVWQQEIDLNADKLVLYCTDPETKPEAEMLWKKIAKQDVVQTYGFLRNHKNEQVYQHSRAANVVGSTLDKRFSWFKALTVCYMNDPKTLKKRNRDSLRKLLTCAAADCEKPAAVGGHVELRGDKCTNWHHIIPICSSHNGKNYDYDGQKWANEGYPIKVDTYFIRISRHQDH